MQLKVAIIKDLYVSLQRIEGKACFARHIISFSKTFIHSSQYFFIDLHGFN